VGVVTVAAILSASAMPFASPAPVTSGVSKKPLSLSSALGADRAVISRQ
jgi:hypothetical protein